MFHVRDTLISNMAVADAHLHAALSFTKLRFLLRLHVECDSMPNVLLTSLHAYHLQISFFHDYLTVNANSGVGFKYKAWYFAGLADFSLQKIFLKVNHQICTQTVSSRRRRGSAISMKCTEHLIKPNFANTFSNWTPSCLFLFRNARVSLFRFIFFQRSNNKHAFFIFSRNCDYVCFSFEPWLSDIKSYFIYMIWSIMFPLKNITFESGGATMKNILYFIFICYHSYLCSVTISCHIKNEAEKQTCVVDSHLNKLTEM